MQQLKALQGVMSLAEGVRRLQLGVAPSGRIAMMPLTVVRGCDSLWAYAHAALTMIDGGCWHILTYFAALCMSSAKWWNFEFLLRLAFQWLHQSWKQASHVVDPLPKTYNILFRNLAQPWIPEQTEQVPAHAGGPLPISLIGFDSNLPLAQPSNRPGQASSYKRGV